MARGFQEADKPQSDSPTVTKESLKILIALAVNKDFGLALMDIRADFLQGNLLDRDIFMKPLSDQRMDGYLWELKKPFYGLDDASRKFWLKLKQTLKSMGLKVIIADDAIYYLHEEGELKGVVLTHVEDLILARDSQFIEWIRILISDVWKVSKVARDKFRFNGWDIEKYEDKITVSMKDYAESIEK